MNNAKLLLAAALAALWLSGIADAVADDHDVDAPAEPELPAPAAAEARDSSRLPAAAAIGLDRAAEATIRLMDDADARLPDDLLNDLALPDLPDVSRGGTASASGNAANRGSSPGPSPAAGSAADNLSRSDIGREVADGVRDNARENAADMAGEARERVENRGRSEDFVPGEPPGRPDQP